MDYANIRQAVLAGAFDDNLTQLAADVRARKETLAAKRALNARLTLRPGAIVTVNGLSPSYINGQAATVVKVNRTRAVVRFNDPLAAGRFADKDVTVPLTNVQVIDGDAPSAPAAPAAPTNQRMRQGAPIEIPDFGLDWRAQSKWFDEYNREKDIIRFPVADNYAFYEVRGNTLHHVPIGDAYQAHPALLRGLTKREVDEMLERDRKMRELFTKRPQGQGPAGQTA